jgi:hypothetical protein
MKEVKAAAQEDEYQYEPFIVEEAFEGFDVAWWYVEQRQDLDARVVEHSAVLTRFKAIHSSITGGRDEYRDAVKKVEEVAQRSRQETGNAKEVARTEQQVQFIARAFMLQ